MTLWHPVAHASELEHEGDFVCLPWRADAEVAVMRQAGELVAFDNRCPHRGARIFTELSGNREPRCAYHQRLATAGTVRRYVTKVNGGWMFVCDGPGEPHDLVRSIEPADLGEFVHETPPLRLHSTLRLVMDCDWTVAVENALDFEHVETAHASSLAKLALVPKNLGCYADGSSIEEFTSESGRLGRMGRFFSAEQRFDYKHAHLYPYSCLSSTRGWTYSLQHYFPRADGRTEFIHRLYAAETTRPIPEFFDSVARLNEQVFREDAAICALVPAGHDAPLVERERRITHFRRAHDLRSSWEAFEMAKGRL